jgi:protein-disulfide isomerase
MKEDMERKDTANKKITMELSSVTLWKAGAVIFAVLFVISLFTGGFGFGDSSWSAQQIAPAQVPQGNNLQQPQPIIKADLKEDDDFCFGDKNAKVKIFEFSDYQCPFCKRAFEQTFPELQKLAKEGNIRYCVKDYPLPFHAQAPTAAIAANCAGQQNKYWEMHDKLFQTQDSWFGNADASNIFKEYAVELSLDEKKFGACAADPKIAQEVQDDIAEGSAAGVSGTPSFYINGQQLVGAQPWAAFKAIIDQELSK